MTVVDAAFVVAHEVVGAAGRTHPLIVVAFVEPVDVFHTGRQGMELTYRCREVGLRRVFHRLVFGGGIKVCEIVGHTVYIGVEQGRARA